MAVNRGTLRQYVQHSAAVVEAEIRAGPLRWRAPSGDDREEYFRVRVVETIAGSAPEGALELFAHAEGLPRLEAGTRVLLFLERTAERPELAHRAERFPFYTLQAPGEEWTLAPPAEAKAIRAAAQAWAAALRGEGDAGPQGVRTLLRAELTSGVARLREDALAELMRASRVPGLLEAPEAVAPFAALVRSGALPLRARVALAEVLEGRPGFDAAAAWRGLVEAPEGPEEIRRLARAASGRPEPAVERWLAGLLAAEDARVRLEAAAALGRPRHAEQVPALAEAARDPDERVALRAIRSLGAVGGPEARAALRALAGEPERPLRASRAEAALRRAAARPAEGPAGR